LRNYALLFDQKQYWVNFELKGAIWAPDSCPQNGDEANISVLSIGSSAPNGSNDLPTTRPPNFIRT
jgi:hypothetical protein